MDTQDQVRRYHEATKHHFYRYARALGYMDWANQPDPFRRFEGAQLHRLPILSAEHEPRSPYYADLYRAGAISPRPVIVQTLSRFFEYALAITAWKEFQGTRWALRSNPSSGNLHPTEGYALIPAMPGLASTPGLYHYAPKEHGLELRMECAAAAYDKLVRHFPTGTFVVGLSSIHWREAWKYGERAFRYCQHDAGHAIAGLRLAASAQGWHAAVLEGTSDDMIARVLGLDRVDDFRGAEREYPDCLMAIWPREPAMSEGLRVTGGAPDAEAGTIPLFLDTSSVQEVAEGTWHGRANRLSREDPVPWEIIDEVAGATWKSTMEPLVLDSPLTLALPPKGRGEDRGRGESEGAELSAGQIIRQRRSAVSLDGKTGIKAEAFFRMLERVMPQAKRRQGERPVPWDVWPWEPRIHLGLFVHLVEGIPPGLYALVRDASKQDGLRQAMHEHFVWAAPKDCPDSLPLYLLQEGDARELAAQVSCHQAIAGDGAFSLGMLADYEHALSAQGAWFYRRLYWETGMIGQVLYLEAEAAGIRATGIGCFFDDPVHRVFGLKERQFQSLYHFTAGGPVDDPRLTTLPAYEIP